MNEKLLKAFSQINNGIVLNKGEKISTISPAMNIFAVAEAKSEFDFAIYDISQFLAALSLTSEDNRKIDVKDDVMNISDSTTKLKYVNAQPDLIATPPEDISPLTDLDHKNEFSLPADVINRIVQASSVMKADTIKFTFEDDCVHITTHSEEDDSNSFELSLDCDVQENMECSLDVKSFKIIENDYKASVSEKAMRLVSDEVTYFVVLT